MKRDYELVLFNITRDNDGLYTATSPDLSGVCVVHRDRARIVEDMPNIVRTSGIGVTAAWKLRHSWERAGVWMVSPRFLCSRFPRKLQLSSSRDSVRPPCWGRCCQSTNTINGSRTPDLGKPVKARC